MKRFVVSPRAQVDLEKIWNYTAARWSDQQAEGYIREIWQAIEVVAADPRKGRACDDVRAGYRKHLVGAHVLFFREIDAGIDVVRILHQRIDFERHM